MSVGRPYYDLEEVRMILDRTAPRDHVFTKANSLDWVVSELTCSEQDAELFILKGIRELELANYSGRVMIEDIIYDVYGKRIKDVPWYIKFALIEEDEDKFIFAISFHPPVEDLRTNGGILKKREES